jgi:DNA-binding NtrC family response regulator
MEGDCFSRLNPEGFLQTFASESVRLGEATGCGSCRTSRSHIEQLGLQASGFFEAAYRREYGIDGALDRERYADLIVALKNRIGGNFSRASSPPGLVRVVNTRCPFGHAVEQTPELCHMTSSVFGGIAARNFGYAKVVLDRTIARGDRGCLVSVYLDEQLARQADGDEYRREEGRIRAASGPAEVSVRLDERFERLWCRSGKTAERQDQRPHLVAKSPALRRALEMVSVVAPTPATVLVTGETGVGKEVIARAVHALSERWRKPMLAVNCGAIPETLIESALFGHERGAFTGAYEVHHGVFERAHGGTLFLDEIDSLPLAAQARLLRVVQDREFMRVGGKQTMRADVRIVAAASQPLEVLLQRGTFREDLYYRINVLPIHVPPLRERPEDILGLIDHFLARLSERYGKNVRQIGPAARARALGYAWPGNVRELENILERSFLFATGPILDSLLLPEPAGGDAPSGADGAGASLKDLRRQAADRAEDVVLRDQLQRCRGNVSAVARALRVTPRAVHQKLAQHRIDVSAYRGARTAARDDGKRLLS